MVLGVNLDDLGDHRPGQRAAAEAGAVFPLVEAGFTKAMVRAASRYLGLRTWDKPAAACLASRVPYGTAVTVDVLSRVERAEAALKGLGFADLRVRHYDDTARLEVPIGELADGRRSSGRRGGRGAAGGVPLRDPRPRGPAFGQPQPGPGRLTGLTSPRCRRRP